MAGLGRKTWSAGDVLAASDVNGYLMDQSVMVFAGTAARSSAIPSPAEGMVTYRKDTDQLESYDGSNWKQVGGLVLIKSQTVGSGVTSITVTDAFSTNYDNYKVFWNNGTGSTGININLKIGSATTAYYGSRYVYTYATSTQSVIADNNGSVFSQIAFVSTSTSHAAIEIVSPFLSKPTIVNSYRAGSSDAMMYVGSVVDSNSYTDFTFVLPSGTATGGTIYVYGYKK